MRVEFFHFFRQIVSFFVELCHFCWIVSFFVMLLDGTGEYDGEIIKDLGL